jgi:hypothetical protein
MQKGLPGSKVSTLQKNSIRIYIGRKTLPRYFCAHLKRAKPETTILTSSGSGKASILQMTLANGLPPMLTFSTRKEINGLSEKGGHTRVDVMITVFGDFCQFSAKKWRFSHTPML